jgi:hypothetical protein
MAQSADTLMSMPVKPLLVLDAGEKSVTAYHRWDLDFTAWALFDKRKGRNEKGEAEASPFSVNQLTTGLVTLILASVIGSSKARGIQLDSQIAFSQFLRTDVADEGEAVAVLEVSLSDNVALESRGSRNTVVTAIAQSKDQLCAAGN